MIIHMFKIILFYKNNKIINNNIINNNIINNKIINNKIKYIILN